MIEAELSRSVQRWCPGATGVTVRPIGASLEDVFVKFTEDASRRA